MECLLPTNLSQLLERASHHTSRNGIRVYQPGSHGSVINNTSVRLTYQELARAAKTRSETIRDCLAESKGDTVVIIHFTNQLESILWFWAVVLAGFVPCISWPLEKDLGQRELYLLRINCLFKQPLILTSSTLAPDFLGLKDLVLLQVDKLLDAKQNAHYLQLNSRYPGFTKAGCDIACLTLATDIFGKPKALIHLHEQILCSIRGKSVYHGISHDPSFANYIDLDPAGERGSLYQKIRRGRSDLATHNHPFLNWVGLDHDFHLIETHLQAMALFAEQIHVHKEDITKPREGPLLFLRLLSDHRVAHTFGPNSFLDAIRNFLTTRPAGAEPLNLELSSLQNFISGGERSSVANVDALTKILQAYGAPKIFIRPAFGMNETCGGSIYSRDSPEFDMRNLRGYASLDAQCVPGMSMRIMTDGGKFIPPNVPGSLQVGGSIVSPGYYSSPYASASDFTADGWVRTGFIALINSDGRLIINGRAKSDFKINGIQHWPDDIDLALEEAGIPGLTPNQHVVFCPPRAPASPDAICVVYVPNFDVTDKRSRVKTRDSISKVVFTETSARPYRVITLPTEFLQTTSLEKVTNMSIVQAFRRGDYDAYLDEHLVKEYRKLSYRAPTNEMERKILSIFSSYETLGDNFDVDSNLVEIGLDSMQLIQLKVELDCVLALRHEIKIVDILANPTTRSLAKKLATAPDSQYNPLVVLRSDGYETPLWLIHPAMGEVLVFLQLARYFNDRPVYALRPRGFEGDEHFKDIPDVVESYYKAILKTQPTGPYAIAGYSFGGIIAFEVAKLLQAQGGEVKFLGIFDEPPELRRDSFRLDWYGCLTALSSFLGLLLDDDRPGMLQNMREQDPSTSAAVDMIVARAAQDAMHELGLTNQKLEDWAGVAYRLQEIGRSYDPAGRVPQMDVFYTVFRSYRAQSDEDWLQNHLGRWKQYVGEEAKEIFCYNPKEHRIEVQKESFGEWKIWVREEGKEDLRYNRDEEQLEVKKHLGEWEIYQPPENKNTVKYHFCEGTHYDMISTHVATFQRRLKAVLAERGL